MMNDRRVFQQAETAGLCDTCRHLKVIRNDRGSVFYLCRLSFTDPRFPRYPAIPVVACPGYEPEKGPNP
jgi:hypothetical protein